MSALQHKFGDTHLWDGLAQADNETDHSIAGNVSDPCVHQFTTEFGGQFVLLVVVVPLLCAFGVVGNLLTILVLSRPRLRSSPSALYLIFIALSDLGVLFTYVLLYTVEVLYDFYHSFTLYRAWFTYIRPVFWLSHVFQVSSTYLTVAATVERWAIIVGIQRRQRRHVSQRQTVAVLCAVGLFTLALTATKLFEPAVVENAECDNVFGMFKIRPSALLKSDVYITVYSLWISSVFFVFTPFVLLLFFNVQIVLKLARSKSLRMTTWTGLGGAMSVALMPVCRRVEERINREKAKMTNVLLVVATVFLVCNAPSVVLASLENVARSWLDEHEDFYVSMRDTINLLAVVNASVNFLVYVIFGSEFRVELRNVACSLCGYMLPPCGWSHKRTSAANVPMTQLAALLANEAIHRKEYTSRASSFEFTLSREISCRKNTIVNRSATAHCSTVDEGDEAAVTALTQLCETHDQPLYANGLRSSDRKHSIHVFTYQI